MIRRRVWATVMTALAFWNLLSLWGNLQSEREWWLKLLLGLSVVALFWAAQLEWRKASEGVPYARQEEARNP